MSIRQTRRQAAQAAAAAAESPKVAVEETEQVTMNGNGNGATRTEPSESGPKENIFLFWPNIIGYSRIVLAIASLYYMPLHPRTCSLLYSVSCLLDALDGYAARAFEQSTRFGAVLDMTVLFVFCAANELFFIALYLLSFSSPLLSPSLLNSVSNSDAAQIQAGAQVNTSLLSQIFPNPYSAAALEMARANKMDSFWPWVLTGVSFPIMAMKQFINVVQIVKASKWLAEGDLAMRRAQGLPRKVKST
ncbi:hypothetical protein COL922a_001116 [Colletotrichum nupharicola]|nr:hypothetical protein COL922a_001116 [Colletotrichum nupharicola]